MISGYSLTDVGAVVSFAKARRYGSADLDIERSELSYETDRGKRWVYSLFERRNWRIDYRVTLAELAVFQTMDAAVKGIAFYFVPDVASPSTRVHVRKEKDFRPKEFEKGVSVSGSITRLYDYSLVLTQEPTAAEVLA